MLSIDGWSHLQTVDYEQIPFKCKYCHEYGHFAKSCPKKPEKPPSENTASEGWNIANGKKAAKPQKQQNPSTKSPPGNKFAALEVETQDEGNLAENPENQEDIPDPVLHQTYEVPETVVQPQKSQDEEAEQLKGRKEMETISEGSVTRSKAKASTEEMTDTSIEEQESLPRKGRKTNKVIREQEAAREKAAGKQSNLDFLVKTSQASKYLMSAEEERKEKEKALKQHKK